jgi:holo-[acyl-carrier protein] synthase
MSTIGVGIDLVEVARVRRMLGEKGTHVFERLLTPGEARYCLSKLDPSESVAVRLATKEAVYKALQSTATARGVGWRDIEVVRDENGRPEVVLTGLAQQVATQLGVRQVMVSLSHTHEAAIAIALLQS